MATTHIHPHAPQGAEATQMLTFHNVPVGISLASPNQRRYDGRRTDDGRGKEDESRGSKEEEEAFTEILEILTSAPGYRRVYWGRRVEDAERGEVVVHVVRTSLQAHYHFLASPLYSRLLTATSALCTAAPSPPPTTTSPMSSHSVSSSSPSSTSQKHDTSPPLPHTLSTSSEQLNPTIRHAILSPTLPIQSGLPLFSLASSSYSPRGNFIIKTIKTPSPSPSTTIADLTPKPPNPTEKKFYLHAPVTGTAIYHTTSPQTWDHAWSLWASIVSQVPGFLGIWGGYIIEDIFDAATGTYRKGGFVAFVGWETTDVHESYHHSRHFEGRRRVLEQGNGGWLGYGHVRWVGGEVVPGGDGDGGAEEGEGKGGREKL